MTTEKKLGIWMDHSSAHLVEFTADAQETKTVHSKFTHEEKEKSLHLSESHMHNKEQHDQSEYYKELGEIIRGYEEVLIFGPTEAKEELYNTLKDDHLFANIKIKVEQTDKMTDSQVHAFVKNYFSKH